MIIGDPYKFAFWVDIVPSWNDDSAWINGIFCMLVNGKIYPCVDTSTLNSELPSLLYDFQHHICLSNNETLFCTTPLNTIKYLLSITYPDSGDNDYSYKFMTSTLEDNGVYAFVVAHDDNVRILITKASDDKGIFEVNETGINEVIISKSTLCVMVNELDSYYHKIINNKQQTD